MNIRFLMMAAVVLFCGAANAQQEEGSRKKVAVVLSGGGAKGMAHIGVLKVIERAGIPVDIVTGTSMGSIVGGLYAIGYNANALDSLVRKQDWGYVITDREDLTKQSLADRRKQNTYALTTGLTLNKRNYNDGGLIKGKNLAELFQQLCVGYTDSVDFSRDLPIPFACVATNIIDNSEVDFHSGRLPQAMRASMAIPVAFSPVRMGDMVLVDGGLRNNYPADIAREMGADIIIGVTLQGEPKKAEDLGGVMSILGQIVDVNCKNKFDENVAITDVPIRVNTAGYGTASFNAAAIDSLIRRGEEEAMRHWDELIALKSRIGIDDSFHPVIPHPKHQVVMTGNMPVKEYVFENMTPQDERFLRAKFHLVGAGSVPARNGSCDSIDSKRMQQITTSMRVDLFYQTAECRVEPVSKGDYSGGEPVRVILTAGNRKTAQVYAGFRYDNEEYAAVQLGADIPLKSSMPMDVDITLRLGKRLKARADMTFHPRSFTRPTISYAFYRNDIDVYLFGNRDYNIRYNQSQAELTPINIFVRNFNLAMSLRWDYMHYRNMLMSGESNGVSLENDHYFSYRAKVEYNSEDNWNFPSKGSRFKAEYSYLTDNLAKLDGKSGMSAISAHWRTSFTFGNRFTLQPMLYGRMLFGTNIPLVFGNAIGTEWFGHYLEQQMPFAGVGNMEYLGNHFMAMQLQAQYRIGDNHYLQLRMAGAQQAGSLRELFDTRTLLGVQAAYSFQAPLVGPVGAALGYSNHTKDLYFYVNLGYEF